MFTANNVKAIQDGAEPRMQKAVDSTCQEFHSLHTGRASVSLVENIKVDYYNTVTALKGVAGITTPDHKTILIQPWDISALSAIEKAISVSGLGLAANN